LQYHCRVIGCVPLTAVEKKKDVPSTTVVSAGVNVNDGAITITVNFEVVEVSAPSLFDTITE
jgi:hypothetical protein